MNHFLFFFLWLSNILCCLELVRCSDGLMLTVFTLPAIVRWLDVLSASQQVITRLEVLCVALSLSVQINFFFIF